MLLQLREFIKSQQVVSVQQLAREFHIDEHALQPMLAIWVNKGVIHPCQEPLACQSRCAGCGAGKATFYKYINASGC